MVGFQSFKDSSFEEREVRSGAHHLIGRWRSALQGSVIVIRRNFTPCPESAVACTLLRSSRRCGDNVNWSSEAMA